MRLLIANIPSCLLACIGGYMAVNGIDGWDWFLFVSLLCFCYPKVTSK